MINMPSNSKLESKQNGIVSLATTRVSLATTRARFISDAKRLRSEVKETMFQETKSAKTSLKANKLQAASTKTNGPIHPQPTLYKTYGPYIVLVPFNSAFLLDLTFNTCHEKERTQKYFGSHLEFKSFITWTRVNESDIFRQSNGKWNGSRARAPYDRRIL